MTTIPATNTVGGLSSTSRWTVLISRTLIGRAAQVFLAAWLLFYLVEGLGLALHFDGAPYDGPFQLFNPLRRIAAGQRGGRDFIYFHGMGVPYLHYPLFALFGAKSLIASELSRQWTSILLFIASLAAFVRVTVGRSYHMWMAAAASVMLTEALFPGGAAAGNSLISARSTMPVFAFVVLQLPVRTWMKAPLVGCCIGLGFVLGTEHAIGLALALLLTVSISAVQAVMNRSLQSALVKNIQFAAIALTVAGVGSTLVLWLLCGLGGAKNAVYYSLVELPEDQFWYFGAPPMPFLGAWREFVVTRHVIWTLLPTYVAIIILGWLLAKSWSRPLGIGRHWPALATLMLLYGILSGIPLLGFLSKHYVFPLARVLVLVAVLAYGTGMGPYVLNRWRSWRWVKWRPAAAGAFIIVCLIAAGALAAKSSMRLAELVQHVRGAHPAYSRYLNSNWDMFMANTTRLIDSTQQRARLSLWSAYSALLESHYGVFSPAEDYMIHAGGPRRWQGYLDTFRATNPEFVTTLTQDFSFEEWLQNERWAFYEDLLDNYELLQVVNHATVWHRKSAPWRVPSQDFQAIQPDLIGGSYTLPVVSGSDRLGVVRVRYAIENPLGWIPLVGKTPRYLAGIEGSSRNLPISFPPYLSEFEFPVELQVGRPLRVRFTTASLLPGVVFHIREVHAKVLESSQAQRAIFAKPMRLKGTS